MKKPQLKKLSRRHVIALLVLVIIIVAVAAYTFFFLRQTPVQLNAEYYNSTAVVDIDKDQYNQLIKDEKSFVVMVDNPGCTTTARMREFMSELPANLQFSYYRIMWQDAKETSLHDFVKYFPSIVVVDHGRVSYYLRADEDVDSNYYNDAAALQSWLEQRIKFD